MSKPFTLWTDPPYVWYGNTGHTHQWIGYGCKRQWSPREHSLFRKAELPWDAKWGAYDKWPAKKPLGVFWNLSQSRPKFYRVT